MRVVAASVNPVDWKMARGRQRLVMPVMFPMTPGFDVAGEVVELGPGVTGFTVGERVHARLRKNEGGRVGGVHGRRRRGDRAGPARDRFSARPRACRWPG